MFIRDLGWDVVKIGRWHAFIKKFPFIGSYIKIQKIKPPIPFEEIAELSKQYRAFKLQVAPDILSSEESVKNKFAEFNYKIDNFPNIPTKTIQIELTKSERELFNNFTDVKRRAVRKAIKNKLEIRQSNNITDFINIRAKQHFPLGFLLKEEMEKIWQYFYPQNAILLLACARPKLPLAGVLLLFFGQKSYYWYASSLPEGKKLFAPTLLIWEALKVSKAKGAKLFDFEGVYDERYSKATSSWRGFTKFKEGFGGQEVSYLGSFKK